MKVDEQSLFEEEKEQNDREHIILAFGLFLSKTDPLNFLTENNIDLGDYTEHYIKSLLKTQEVQDVNAFIKILNDNNLLQSSSSSFSD